MVFDETELINIMENHEFTYEGSKYKQTNKPYNIICLFDVRILKKRYKVFSLFDTIFYSYPHRVWFQVLRDLHYVSLEELAGQRPFPNQNA